MNLSHYAILMICVVQGSASVFGVNIFATDAPFDIKMVEDLITKQGVYNFRVFNPEWITSPELYTVLNKYAQNGKEIGTSLLLNIGWNKRCSEFAALFQGYSFDIAVQIDSCAPTPDMKQCPNPTEGGFCQTGAADVNKYIEKLNTCNDVLPKNIEFIIPWQNNYVNKCGYDAVLQAALKIQQSDKRKFSLSGTFYNFFHGPDIGAGVFPSSNIDELANQAQEQATAMANGLTVGFRLVETAWPMKCQSKADKGHGAASLTAMCKYYGQARIYNPSKDVKIFWWLIDDRDVGDKCGAGAWGLYDASGNFKCNAASTTTKPWVVPVVVISVIAAVVLIIFGSFKLYRHLRSDVDHTGDHVISENEEIPLHPRFQRSIRNSITENFKEANKKRFVK